MKKSQKVDLKGSTLPIIVLLTTSYVLKKNNGNQNKKIAKIEFPHRFSPPI